MELLGVGPLELLFVLILAILIIGPDDLGKTARSIGRFLNRMYKSDEWKAVTQASRSLRTLPNRLAREAELEQFDELRADIEQASQEIHERGSELLKKGIPETTAKEGASQVDRSTGGLDAWIAPPEKSQENIAGTADSKGTGTGDSEDNETDNEPA